MSADLRPALWVVLWSRALTTFSGAVGALAYSYVAIHHLGGPSAGVAVATCTAVGVLVGNLAGGLADFVRAPLVIGGAALVGAVTSGTAFILADAGRTTLPTWCVLSLLSGLVTAAAARGENTAIVHVAPREHLPRLFGVVSIRAQAAAAAAGTVSGLVIASDPALPFLVDCASWALSGVLLIPLALRYPRSGADRPSFSPSELLRGFTFIAQQRPLLTVVVVSAIANMFLAGASAVITIDLISRGTDVRLVGLLETVVNLAALLGSVASGVLSRRLTTRQLFVLVLSVLTGAMAAMAIWGTVQVVMVALAVGVFSIPALGVSAAITLASWTPAGLQARTSGASSVLSLVLTSVSPAALGSLYLHTSRLVTLSVVATGTLAAAAIARRAVPDRRTQDG
ncbi:Major Facilitator Superfamily protein [Curtobacterium sp. 9128]|uniref:MFS transporter n=1 Tax=Curtobacterium sp. 9128 TaxID=1793722 RepID=UPI0007D721FF|nr:MFS transporter [Curtobacterium sp. 9128]SBN62476.1 Major Facilitator Superfamily protein [Curtobacterium sp. 9128]